jgi:hypothetical protein
VGQLNPFGKFGFPPSRFVASEERSSDNRRMDFLAADSIWREMRDKV